MENPVEKLIPDVSILIPVYGTAEWLPRALDSVLSQTHRNLEAVCVNDASPDGAAGVLAEYAKRDSRIRVVSRSQNGGTQIARLEGFKASRGRYIMCLDADDSLDSDCVASLLELARKTDAEIVGFGARLLTGDAKIDRYMGTIDATRRSLRGSAIFEAVFARHAYNWSLCLKMVKRGLFERAAVEMPYEYCVSGEDFLFFTMIAYFAQSFESTERIFYNYFISPGICRKKEMDLSGFKRFATLFQALRHVHGFLERHEEKERWQQAFAEREKEHFDYVFARWPRRVRASDCEAAYAWMRQIYDASAVEKAMRRYFAHSPQFLEGVGEGDFSRLSDLPPEPGAERIGLWRRLLPTESRRWKCVKRLRDLLKRR